MPGKAKLWETASASELAYLSQLACLAQSSDYKLAFKLLVILFNCQNYSLIWIVLMKPFSGAVVLSIQSVSQYCLIPMPLRY